MQLAKHEAADLELRYSAHRLNGLPHREAVGRLAAELAVDTGTVARALKRARQAAWQRRAAQPTSPRRAA